MENMPEIYINADGNIEPQIAPIKRNGNTYTLTDDITKYQIVIRRDGIVLDGKGHTLLGRGICPILDTAITIRTTPSNFTINRQNVTIKNFNIENFRIGISVPSVSNCIIINNTIKHGEDGIRLGTSYAENNKITNNTLLGGLQDYGVGISAFGSYNSVIGNDISGFSCGIEFDYGNHNIAFNNTLSNIMDKYIDTSSIPDTVLGNNSLPAPPSSPIPTSIPPVTTAKTSPLESISYDFWSLTIMIIIIIGTGLLLILINFRYTKGNRT
jgi:parallel beta-helix repeat protein